ncbi:MAG: hypothetical protein M1541_16050 [Acidobacteria bacterium]|nr:hypothetical protein [Acidobacteriota bacterium]
MRAQGVTRQEVARLFGITPGRVAMIEQRAATEQAQAEQRGQFQAELRLADDLDNTWPVLNLLDVLHLLPVARTRLLAYLGEQHKTRMSLREFMDLVVSENGDPSEVFAHTPLLRVREIGKIGYYSVAAELTETDLGPRCNEEWQRRLGVLRREWRIPSWPPNPRLRYGWGKAIGTADVPFEVPGRHLPGPADRETTVREATVQEVKDGEARAIAPSN